MARRREATIAPATGPYCDMQDLLGLRAAAARLQLQPPWAREEPSLRELPR